MNETENISDIQPDDIQKDEYYEQLIKQDEFIKNLSMTGFEINAVAMKSGKQGGLGGSVLFDEWIKTDIELDKIYYLIGMPGQFQIFIRPIGSKSMIKGVKRYTITITQEKFSKAYQKYKHLDQTSFDRPNSPSNQINQPQFTNPFMANPYMQGENDQMSMLKVFVDMFEKMNDKIERALTEKSKPMIDSDVIKLAMINQGQESMKGFMQVLLESNKKNGGSSEATEILKIMNDNSNNTQTLLTTLLTSMMSSKSSSLNELEQLINITRHVSELTPQEDKGMLDKFLESPASASIINGVMGMLGNNGNNHAQQQPQGIPQEQLVAIKKELEFAKQVQVENQKLKEMLAKSGIKLENTEPVNNSKIESINQKQINNDLPQQAQEANMLGYGKLIGILKPYLDGKIDVQQVVLDLVNNQDDKTISSLLLSVKSMTDVNELYKILPIPVGNELGEKLKRMFIYYKHLAFFNRIYNYLKSDEKDIDLIYDSMVDAIDIDPNCYDSLFLTAIEDSDTESIDSLFTFVIDDPYKNTYYNMIDQLRNIIVEVNSNDDSQEENEQPNEIQEDASLPIDDSTSEKRGRGRPPKS